MSMENAKILISSPIRQKPKILQEFLDSLKEIDTTELSVDFLFVDNNDDEASSDLLNAFNVSGSQVYVGQEKPAEAYLCNENTHHWNEGLIWKLAILKNFILNFALTRGYSHVMLIDSDLVLHPQTLRQLVSAEKDIISEIFWTQWSPGTIPLPQVWVTGEYSFHKGPKSISEQERNAQLHAVLNQLKNPGVYQVGGLGACTLISAKVIEAGVNFNQISNVDYWGEDRHFCIRAAVMGFKLYVDTHYPAFHIYRESELDKVAEYKCKNNSASTGWQRKSSGNKLTLSMIVRNEADHYLRQMLEHTRHFIDAAVIIDDASTDNTAEICQEILKDIPLTLIKNEASLFSQEYKLRQMQWQETIKTNPDWILMLDADEIMENKTGEILPQLMNQREIDLWSFQLFDFWDDEHYRDDDYWKAHKYYRPFLVRYIPAFEYVWQETPQHCGRFPCNIMHLKNGIAHLRIKHYGWADPKNRKEKHDRYMKLDPEAKYGIKAQYDSILDPDPNLIRWIE